MNKYEVCWTSKGSQSNNMPSSWNSSWNLSKYKSFLHVTHFCSLSFTNRLFHGCCLWHIFAVSSYEQVNRSDCKRLTWVTPCTDSGLCVHLACWAQSPTSFPEQFINGMGQGKVKEIKQILYYTRLSWLLLWLMSLPKFKLTDEESHASFSHQV